MNEHIKMHFVSRYSPEHFVSASAWKGKRLAHLIAFRCFTFLLFLRIEKSWTTIEWKRGGIKSVVASVCQWNGMSESWQTESKVKPSDYASTLSPPSEAQTSIGFRAHLILKIQSKAESSRRVKGARSLENLEENAFEVPPTQRTRSHMSCSSFSVVNRITFCIKFHSNLSSSFFWAAVLIFETTRRYFNCEKERTTAKRIYVCDM